MVHHSQSILCSSRDVRAHSVQNSPYTPTLSDRPRTHLIFPIINIKRHTLKPAFGIQKLLQQPHRIEKNPQCHLMIVNVGNTQKHIGNLVVHFPRPDHPIPPAAHFRKPEGDRDVEEVVNGQKVVDDGPAGADYQEGF